MSETKWRECDDPEVLAAAVAAGVEVQVFAYAELAELAAYANGWYPAGYTTAEQFAYAISDGVRYRVPARWQPTPEPPDGDEPCATNPCEACRDRIERAEPPADDLRERIARVIDDWHNTVEMWTELDDLADAVLAVLPTPPVPPWPGAVLSGLVDEDGQPTWLAQAGNVRGEQIRCAHALGWTKTHGYRPTEWVEVRAPRPAPATERVPWWEAVGRWTTGDELIVEVARTSDGPVVTVEGGGRVRVAPDGTVEVLARDGDQ